VKITTSLCYLPDDKKIDKVGISPDIFIESAEDDLSIANLMGWKTTKGRANSPLRFKDKAHPVTSKADHQHNDAMLAALDVLHNQEQYSILLAKNSNEKRKN
jgi:C-terminal processing protease CtpA/Prc